MAKPKVTPIMKIGMKLTSGPGVCTSPHRPSCQNSTVTPNAAPTESRKPRPAVNGTTSERNTNSNSTMARPMTTDRYTGIASDRRCVMSCSMGIRPVTPVTRPVASSIWFCCARSAEIRAPVSLSRGPAFGVSIIITPVRSRFMPIICTCSTSTLFLKLSSA